MFIIALSQIAINVIEDVANAIAQIAESAESQILHSVVDNWTIEQITSSEQEFSNILLLLINKVNYLSYFKFHFFL